MILDLSKITFINDFASFDMPSGDTLLLNKINESILYDTDKLANIDVINLQVVSEDNSYTYCPSVIGMKNDILSINTEYTYYEGKVLTSENMKYCTLEIYE